ncbi:MAG: KH domain-containing protein [Caldilineaceae bacterium]|nr:KH domain-containing protein [Caldilineaceae bacterium]MCB0089186.1 KH domain-containing protein [Caldilineaceae bacterium]MCB0097735.1 KH domain-containing protein [Caldilineaceae bacterium]MCB0138387.1 KH domain-containing protein [Caldilineaceae bacterium]MCB9151467.1 KH domain-containing protein [Caldilineaceae bacterium]
MEELVKFLAQSLVEEPDKVHVYVKETRNADIYKLQVASDDVGRVIGKHGRVANALRTVLRAANFDDDRNIILEID